MLPRFLALASLVAPLLFATTSAAQVTGIPNTGCQRAAPMKWAGSPQLGGCVDFYPPDPTVPSIPAPEFFLLGLPLQTPLRISYGCAPGPCQLGVAPLVAVAPDPTVGCLSICVPQNPVLIGFTLALQHARFEVPPVILAAPVCVRLSQAYAITIQR